ncbi:MAG TPA: integrin [Kofleriaceae bacterium]
MTMRRAGWVVVGWVLGASACASGHHIGGEVQGMWKGADGVALRLQADGVDNLLVVPANGPFEFPHQLGTGTSYTVMVAGHPAMHTCAIEAAGNGIVADTDVTEISIRCAGPPVALGLSRPDWVFDPSAESQTFDTSAFQDRVTLHLEGPSLLSAKLNGQPVPLGQDLAPLLLQIGPNSAIVDLVASGGLSRRYELIFRRGAGDVRQLAFGKSSTTMSGAQFGQAVAIDRDTLVIGAPNEGLGAVHVFGRTGDGWIEQARVASPSSRGFGQSVAVSGNTLVVGAPGDDSGATGIDGDQTGPFAFSSGAAYVFVRSGTSWLQQAYIKASNTNELDTFGASVALSGDTLLVGAPGEASSSTGIDGNQMDNSAMEAGAVFVFQRDAVGRWEQRAYLKASNTDAHDGFGTSVAVSGDTAVVGSPAEASSAVGINGDQNDDGAVFAGAVYVFVRAGASWTQQAYIKASTARTAGGFGSSLALSSDTLAVGAFAETGTSTGINGSQRPSGVPSGAVYVFGRASGQWTQQAYVKASNTGGGDAFGASVALSPGSGDILAVGAWGEASSGRAQADDSAPGAGAAYLFARSGDTWVQGAYVKASNVDTGDKFGTAVALSAAELVVGAPRESSATGVGGVNAADNSAPAAGAIYIFR